MATGEICSSCSIMIGRYKQLKGALSGAKGGFSCYSPRGQRIGDNGLPKISPVSSAYSVISKIEIYGKPIDDGTLEGISRGLGSIPGMLDAMISECNEYIDEYSKCNHLEEDS